MADHPSFSGPERPDKWLFQCEVRGVGAHGRMQGTVAVVADHEQHARDKVVTKLTELGMPNVTITEVARYRAGLKSTFYAPRADAEGCRHEWGPWVFSAIRNGAGAGGCQWTCTRACKWCGTLRIEHDLRLLS